MEKIYITTDYIKLDQLLKYANVVGSGGESKIIIKEGKVKVNGEIETQRGKKVRHNDIVEFNNIKFLVLKNEE